MQQAHLALMHWKRLCTSFRSHSSDLCDAIASLTKRICTAYLDPKGLEAFVACRLIALDKCPGVRPIGIGETLRRIIGKAISNTLKYDIQDAVGPLQLCAGFEKGDVRLQYMPCSSCSAYRSLML